MTPMNEPENNPTTTPAAEPRKSGRAVFDDRGSSVWEWQTATGVFERHISEEQMSRLEEPSLQLVEPAQTDTRGRCIYEGQKPARTYPETRKPMRVAMKPAPRASFNPLRDLWRRLVTT
jgi:hypothetical protein